MDTTKRRRPRRARGAGDTPDNAPDPFSQKPFKQPQNPYPPQSVVSEDELEQIHEASLDVLENIGIDFMNEEAKAILKNAGADVDPDSDRVKLDRGLVMEAIRTLPESFTVHARNPDKNLVMGGRYAMFASVGSPPNASDMDGGRRPGNRADFRNLLKLAQFFNIIHIIAGYPVEPVDLHPSIRHLDAISDTAKLTDKVFNIYSLGRERNLDGFEMARIVRGVSREQFEKEPSVLSIINTSSPLRIDTPMLQGVIEMARVGQPTIITPFTLAGAMAPVTVAGALVLQNAEALAGLAFGQLVKPGAPMVYGGFTSNVDMKSGAPAFGTPEYMRAAIVGGQLARKYKVPYRTSAPCAANTVDAQAAYETVYSLWGALSGGGNYIKHAAGWLEGGLCASFEKFILDVDILQMAADYMEPLEISKDALSVDTIREVGAGGHFFGSAQTQARYRDAFYAPILSDWRNFETWQEAGSPNAMSKANRMFREALEAYERPAMDPAIEEELDAFVAKRKEEGGAPTDF